MRDGIIRVILVDDHNVVRAGLKAVLGSAKDIEVIGEGSNGKEAISLAERLDPDVIVLGGGLSNIERLYTNVPARWQSHVFSDFADTPIVRALHGDASGVRGAAWLW